MCKASANVNYPVVNNLLPNRYQPQQQHHRQEPPTRILSYKCNLIRNAAHLNREGATALVTGNLQRAIDHLSQALHCIVEAGGLDASPSIASDYKTQVYPFERRAPCSLPAQMRHRQVHKLSDASENGYYFVYCSPFIFQPIAAEVPFYATNCAAVCLFNLALAFHQRGRLADSRGLLRAQILYDMSMTMVSKLPCQAACANLVVAGTNNKAHVLFELSEITEAKATLQALLANLTNKNTSPPPFANAEIEKFYMNILYINGPIVAGAA